MRRLIKVPPKEPINWVMVKALVQGRWKTCRIPSGEPKTQILTEERAAHMRRDFKLSKREKPAGRYVEVTVDEWGTRTWIHESLIRAITKKQKKAIPSQLSTFAAALQEAGRKRREAEETKAKALALKKVKRKEAALRRANRKV